MKGDLGLTSYEAFREAARVALEKKAAHLQEHGFEQFSSLECRWHPNGFAVFHLDDEHELGTIRLHVWPDMTRVVRPDGAPIHTHAWHLCSLILAGNYAETLYEEIGKGLDEARRYHSATINYLVDKNSVTDPSKSLLRPVVTTRATTGEFHEIPAGIPHETHIPTTDFVATLLITSQSVLDQVTMYSLREIFPSSYRRPILDQEQKASLLHRLENEVAINVGE